MPPCVDVYALTDQRNRTLVDQFLDRYGVKPDPFAGGHASSPGDPLSVAGLLDRIVSDPAFLGTAYLKAGARQVHSLVLHGTRDGLLVLGLSIDEPDNWADRGVARTGTERATRFMRNSCNGFPLCTLERWRSGLHQLTDRSSSTIWPAGMPSSPGIRSRPSQLGGPRPRGSR
jgi:hypothetical protein